ncbi:MAG: hypothetical protein AB1428_12975 [Bacteroidota bacterium]
MNRTNSTTGAIIQYLMARGHLAHRNNTTGIYDPRTGRWRSIARGSRGVGDILCCVKGGYWLEIEVKTGKDKPSVSQLQRRERVERTRGVYLVASSFDDFLEKFLKAEFR